MVGKVSQYDKYKKLGRKYFLFPKLISIMFLIPKIVFDKF